MTEILRSEHWRYQLDVDTHLAYPRHREVNSPTPGNQCAGRPATPLGCRSRTRRTAGSRAFNIRLNRLSARETLWYTGFDLAASVLLTGRIPKIRRAFTIVGEGTADLTRSPSAGRSPLISGRRISSRR